MLVSIIVLYTVYSTVYYNILCLVAATSGRGEDGDWDKIIKLCDRIRESFGSAA